MALKDRAEVIMEQALADYAKPALVPTTCNCPYCRRDPGLYVPRAVQAQMAAKAAQLAAVKPRKFVYDKTVDAYRPAT